MLSIGGRRACLARFGQPRSFSATTVSQTYYDKIMVANRGEIACRVFRTAKKLGIKTVAVYSSADVDALHVKMADEAVCVGPPLSSESYLVIDNIVKAAKMTGAQAIHPGYGFLSENRHFVEAAHKAGIDFIGPGEHAMKCMGDKLESKAIAKEAGVHTVPGYVGEITDVEMAGRIAREIGYPVMIKASAGGGGKGMRVAWNDEEVKDGFELSREEAINSFGDDTILIEKFINNPRHIEIQIIGDSHGNIVYLPERECSIQRRNQKVIEEAPSAFLTPETRKAMGEQAVALAKAVGYESAGTVEFLVDDDMNWYFLEMNTRLQVEHPVTEYITGVDLVEQMIRAAAGQPLSITQDSVKINGWSFESRVYAEDPLRNFLPSIGRLDKYVEPLREDPDVRCDSGIVEGSEISIYYDPLICKLVTWGEDRAKAAAKMSEALDSYIIRGVTHNINFLRDVLDAPRFQRAELTTNYIPEEYPEGFKGHVLTEAESLNLVTASSALHAMKAKRTSEIDGALYSYEPRQNAEIIVTVNGKAHRVDVFEDLEEQGGIGVEIRDEEGEVVRDQAVHPSSQVCDDLFDASLLDLSAEPVEEGSALERLMVQVISRDPFGFLLQYKGTEYPVKIESLREHELRKNIPEKIPPDMSKFIQSPMPGRVISLAVQPGDSVLPGAEVAVVEAMKMQNILRCEKGGTVKSVTAVAGTNVAVDEILIEFE